jgi:Glycosyl hydrolase family 63 C-terminal domain
MIIDPQNHINLTIHWVSLETETHTNNDTTRWTLRVTGERVENFPEDTDFTDLSLLWYVGMPGNLTATCDPRDGIITGMEFQTCMVPSVSTIHPSYRDDRNNATKIYDANYFAVFQVPSDQYFNPKPYILQELRNPTSTLPPHLFDPSSLYRSATVMTGNQIVQQAFLMSPFQVDFYLNLQTNSPTSAWTMCHSGWQEATTTALKKARSNFQSRFKDIFINRQQQKRQQDVTTHSDMVAWHRRTSILPSWTNDQIQTAQYALGNMLGSISYMHGKSQIYDHETKSIRYGPMTAGWTIVPDRPDHAQGYLWDDGFHQQLVHFWDMDWSLEILRSWYDKTDGQGWIPRQLIIGDPARWSARPSSWPQVPGTANPPSHHWVLQSLLHYNDQFRQQQGSPSLNNFFRSIWDPLQRNLEWYFRTQASAIPRHFRWAGRTTEYCLPSGMDDYPRAPILTQKEAHLDLHCWLIVSCRTVAKVASYLGMKDKVSFYQQKNVDLTTLLLTSFWDNTTRMFDDFYIDTDNRKTFVGHLGYLNFFPIILDVLPTNSSMFEHTIERFLDRDNGIWTKYGLRSLSDKDPYYMKGDAYWTGLLWLNINYLAVSSLFKYANTEEYHLPRNLRTRIRLAYHELRQGLIQLVVDQFMETGFIWEVYDATTGKGQDNHPFTGWSALIVNILSELY